MTRTVAGNGIAVPPLVPTFEYGTGNCLKHNNMDLNKQTIFDFLGT